MPESQPSSAVVERIASILLALVAVLTVAVAVAGWGWWRAVHRPLTAADLDAAERQQLIQQMVDQSPGVFRWTFFEPRIGYTLRPDAEIELFGETFQSNALGMRDGAIEEASNEEWPATFRILFVGDSWTYGMGVRHDQAFPHLLADLANEAAGVETPIESVTLALPGWNAVNQVAALETYVDLIQPAAVVFVPTTNDHHSTGRVLPNGSIWWGSAAPDFFGDPHTVTYPDPYVDTFRSRQRWLQSFAAWRRAERRLAERDVPTVFFYVARWVEAYVHTAVEHAGLESPYLIMPRRYTLDEWSNPPPLRHASPAGHQLYARSVYRLLADSLGWQPLPPEPRDLEIFRFDRRQPPGALARYEQDRNAFAAVANGQVPTSFRPGAGARRQVAGPIDLRSGRIGRATTLLVRRQEGARALRITVRRLEVGGWLYPLDLTVRIPSPSGGTRVRRTLPTTGERLRFELPIPDDLPAGAVLDVVFETGGGRAVEEPEVVRSMRILEIAPVD